MNRKICLITGGNSGIGKAAALQIAARGHHVILGCRNRERGEEAAHDIETALRETRNASEGDHSPPAGARATASEEAGTVDLLEIDMSLQSSIRRAAGEVLERYPALDVLIHNAAAFDITQKDPKYTSEGIESIWATNHLGPVLLTDLLLPALSVAGPGEGSKIGGGDSAGSRERRSGEGDDGPGGARAGRIITVASKGLLMHPRLTIDFDDPEFRTRRFSVPKAYYQSKLAQVMYTYWLAEALEAKAAAALASQAGARTTARQRAAEQIKRPVTANCVRVANVRIDVEKRYPNLSKAARFIYALKSKASLSPEEIADTYAWLALSDEAASFTGRYVDEHRKAVESPSWSREGENIDRLMKITRRYFETVATHA